MKVIQVEDTITKIKGIFHIRVWKGEPQRINNEWVGELKEERIVQNIMTIKGKQMTLNLLAKKYNVTGLEILGIGIGITGETENDTALETEKGRENITYTSTIIGSGESMVYSAYFGTENPGTTEDITEAGLFGNGATLVADSGDLFARKTFTAVQKTVGEETLTVDYSLSY